MSKARKLALISVLGLAAVLLSIPQSGQAHPAAPQAPILGPHIDIWLDDIPNYGSKVAYNSRRDEYLVVWVNDKGATVDIHARRVTGDGVPLNDFVVVHDENNQYRNPAVACSPEHDAYLIAYQVESISTGTDIWARRVAWDGSWMSGEFPIRIEADDQHDPAVAYNSQGDEYLVVYQNSRGEGGLYDIAAQRVRGSDGVLEGWRNIATAPPEAPDEKRSDPDVAYNFARNEYLITYTYQPTSYTDPGDVYGKVVSAALGDLGDEIRICDTPVSQEWHAVAAGPDEYLVTWTNRFTGDAKDDIYARRVRGDGMPEGLAEGFPVAEGVASQMLPGVAYGASYGYLIVWRRVIGTPGGWHTQGRYVMPGHDWPTGERFEVSDVDAFDTWAQVACAPSGSCFVVMDNIFAGTDLDVQGRLVSPHRVYLPLVVHN